MELARELLDPILERMIDAVHRYEGGLNQVLGNGIMAIFGAPLTLEDHRAAGVLRRLDGCKPPSVPTPRMSSVPAWSRTAMPASPSSTAARASASRPRST